TAVERASRGFMRDSGERMAQALSNLLARCELSLPPESRGAFLSVGSDYSAFVNITNLLSEAETDIFIVDPYLYHTAIQKFLTTSP
ncbi:hypothetical protein, partial [Stenotrophomonas sp. GbtcB23]|uniref:hypothetical protein n=1 Tax=Stenotrophomonas sp. GbtcB23 TaxID=2824768 RepID=UPI001C30D81E